MFFNTMISLQLQLFILIAAGYLCKKIRIITKEAQKSLSDLLIYIILPCNIIAGFTSGIEVSGDLLIRCGLAFCISAVIQLFNTYVTRYLFFRWPREKAGVARYGMIVSNSSFIGIPVMEVLYGSLGVLYTAIFQIPIRFTMWSAGLALFTDVDRKATIKKVLLHPCIISCLIGFVMMVMEWSLSGIAQSTILSLSKCTSPVSMLVIGAILGDINLKKLFDKDVFIFSFVRLIAFPALVYLVLYFLGTDRELMGVAVLLSAMPAGSTAAILAQKYGGDAEYGATLIFVSTLLSIATLPVFSLFI